jgi:hypothetical protein
MESFSLSNITFARLQVRCQVLHHCHAFAFGHIVEKAVGSEAQILVEHLFKCPDPDMLDAASLSKLRVGIHKSSLVES